MIFFSLIFTNLLLTIYFAIRFNRLQAEFNVLKNKLQKETKEGTDT